jgi:ABC-2 type transport system ATP-binding protein
VVTELAGAGVTVFLTTQYLEEADRLADRIALLDGGRIVAEGSADELKSRVAELRLELVAVDAIAYDALVAGLGDRAVATDRARLLVATPTDGTASTIRMLLDGIDPQASIVDRFAIRAATLDDAFLALTTTVPVGRETANV